MKTAERFLDLKAGDMMKTDLVTVPRRASLPDVARLFRFHQISGAPVVDDEGLCVGVLTAADFLRWAVEGGPEADARPVRCCPFQEEGRLLTGEETTICTLSPGSCPLQSVQATTVGPNTVVCRQPLGVLCDWQQTGEAVPDRGVAERYMTADLVSVDPDTPLAEIARRMVDAHIHRVFVLDHGRPVGVITSTDLLAALAWERVPFAGSAGDHGLPRGGDRP